MEYLFPLRNVIADADLDMTNVVPSNAIERSDEAAKAGRGQVVVTGPYTGDADAVVDIEIVDDEIDGAPTPSAPVSNSVGNGTLTGITATDAWDSEIVTLTLESLGTQTRLGEAPFQQLKLQALTPTSEPVVTITRQHTLTATDFVVRDNLDTDAAPQRQEHFNFGAVALTADGLVPTTAPRLRFGSDPQVYWHYKKFNFDAGYWEYGLSPRPVRPIPAGARVWAVTGGYDVQITEGDTVELFAGVVTFYAAAVAIRDGSELVRVLGAIGFDQKPGGSAATDLSINTSSYCASVLVDGSEALRTIDIGLVVGPGAPTETLTITSAGGSEWEVRGDVSGLLARAITNVLYQSDNYEFRIPGPPPPAAGTGPLMTVEFFPTLREGGAPVPALCVDDPRMGINARNGKWEYVYAIKPAAPCSCDDEINIDNPPSDECLGIETQEGVPVTQAAQKRMVERVAQWHAGFVAANTPLYSARSPDIRYADRVADYATKAADQLCRKGQLTFPAWQANKAYTADAQIAVGNYRYATTGGTSGASTPTFPTTIGDTVADNGMTWECIGLKPLLAWEEMWALTKGEADYLKFDAGATWSAGIWGNFPTPDPGQPTILPARIYEPSTKNGHTYLAERGGEPDVTEPASWPTDGSTVVDGDVVWRDRGAYWTPSHAYALGFRTVIPGFGAIIVTEAGTSGASQPLWTVEAGRIISDGTAKWELLSDRSAFTAPNLANDVIGAHYRRIETRINQVLAAGGLQGNFKQTSNGDRCWSPNPDKPGAFLYNGSEEPPYAEIYEGEWYVASKPRRGEDGLLGYYSTQEFAFPPAFSCPESLQVGDRLVITITGVTGQNSGYQQGDRVSALITHATPLIVAGGQVGNDTLTWSVVASETGRLPDYQLNTNIPAPYNASFAPTVGYLLGVLVRPTTPNGYCYRVTTAGTAGAEPSWPTSIDATVTSGSVTFTCVADDPGLQLQINIGGIAFALRDQFQFSFEGGHFRWRTNAGGWSADTPISASVALVDGLVAEFRGGRPPSWVGADQWSYRARAINGVGNLRQPDDRRARWTGSTVLTISGASAADVVAGDILALVEHAIPADATVQLLGSDDGWSTTAFTLAVPWQPRGFIAVVPQACAAYRVTVNRGGSLQYPHLGSSLELEMQNGQPEFGRLAKRLAMPTRQRRGGLGAMIDHSAVAQTSFDALYDGLADATEHHDGRLVVLPNRLEPGGVALVQFAAESLDADDLFYYQPANTSERLLTVRLELQAVA